MSSKSCDEWRMAPIEAPPHLHVLDHALAKEGHRKLLCEVEWLHMQPPQALANGASQGPEHAAEQRNEVPLPTVFSLILPYREAV
jgi:hypothetical protein